MRRNKGGNLTSSLSFYKDNSLVGAGLASMGYKCSVNGSINVLPWYLTTGVSDSDITGVWKAKGASDLVTSYNSLVGSKVLTTTSAPDWNNTDGWIGDGISKYLSTGDIAVTENTTIIARLKNTLVSEDLNFLMGFSQETGYLRFRTYDDGEYTEERVDINDKNAICDCPLIDTVVCITKNGLYIDGVLDSTFSDTIAPFNILTPFHVFGIYQLEGNLFGKCNCAAFGIYIKTLTPTQISSISTKMAAL
jgi:hypothetical protein